jgi:aspartate/methionine/tyrosine aminotransferase
VTILQNKLQTTRRPLFSTRTSWDASESQWSAALVQRRRQGLPIYDLTVANPTDCGFTYPDRLLDPLLNPKALTYDPHPQGLLQAREAVCAYYQDHQRQSTPGRVLSLTPEDIFLTTSTSEAYSFLFRLLCDPEDEVLIAQPSYPLFEYLAGLDDVRLVSYPLFYDYGWHFDFHNLRRKITARTRAIIIVHPNNPTGNFASANDRQELEKICIESNLALIVDEVFLDYGLVNPGSSFTLGEHPAMTFVMSGLSKIAGLPQMKLSWICASGPAGSLRNALHRLEIIADTFLSVNAPMQHALPIWLRQRHHIQKQIGQRVTDNLAILDHALAGSPINRLAIEAGWYAILRVPAIAPGQDLCLHLLEHSGVVTHPGIFFGLPDAGWLVLSLLPPVDAFAAGLSGIVAGTNKLLTA